MATTDFEVGIKDPKYRFAYELVKEVTAILGNTYLLDIKFPQSTRVLFTNEHAHLLQTHLITNGEAKKLDTWIAITITEYSISHLKLLMGAIKKKFGNSTYMDNHSIAYGFICACGDMAYAAAHFMKKNHMALKAAVMFISDWISNEPEDSFIFAYCKVPESE